jgi:hypothetical protein
VQPLSRAVELNDRLSVADPASAEMGWLLVQARTALGDALASIGSIDDAKVQYVAARDKASELRNKRMRGEEEVSPEQLDKKLSALSTPAPTTQSATSPATSP